MLSRFCAALIITTCLAAGAQAQPAAPSFAQRLSGILSQSGSSEAVRGRLDRLAREGTNDDERLAVEAFQLVVRGAESDKGLPLAEAEAFAARHPGSAAPLIAVGHAALNESRIERAADAYHAAIARSPWLAEAIPAAEIDDLTGRLAARGEGRRLLELGRALAKASWTKGSPSSRSYLMAVTVQGELAAGRAEQAKALLPTITDPQLLYALLADKRFAALHGEIAGLWGPHLENRWRGHLASLRDEWMTGGKRDAAIAYATALQQANHHQLLVDQFMPRFMRGYNCWEDPVARRLVGYLVSSLNKLGRQTKARDVLGRLGSLSVASWAGPSLGGILLNQGEFEGAAKVFELSLQQSAKATRTASPEATALTGARLACANHQRGKPVRLPATDALALSMRLWLALCIEDVDTARTLLLAALADEDQRLAAIQWLQPFADPPVSGPFEAEMDRRVRALQAEPQVLAAARGVAIIHDWTLESSAPNERAMRGLPVRRASPCSAREDASVGVEVAAPALAQKRR